MAGMEFGGSKVFPTDTIRPSMSKYSSENLLYMENPEIECLVQLFL